jgi:hypothetical protein
MLPDHQGRFISLSFHLSVSLSTCPFTHPPTVSSCWGSVLLLLIPEHCRDTLVIVRTDLLVSIFIRWLRSGISDLNQSPCLTEYTVAMTSKNFPCLHPNTGTNPGLQVPASYPEVTGLMRTPFQKLGIGIHWEPSSSVHSVIGWGVGATIFIWIYYYFDVTLQM